MFVRETSPDGKISYWTIRPEANRCLTLDQVYKVCLNTNNTPTLLYPNHLQCFFVHMRFHASNVIIYHFVAHPTAFGWPSDPYLPSDHTSWLSSSKIRFPTLIHPLIDRSTGTSLSTSTGISYFISGRFRQTDGSTFSSRSSLVLYL